MKNKGLKILLCVLLVLCIIMAGALIGKEYIGDNIKEAANRNGVDVVKDTSDTGKEDENAVDSTAEGTESTQSDATKAEVTDADTQQPHQRNNQHHGTEPNDRPQIRQQPQQNKPCRQNRTKPDHRRPHKGPEKPDIGACMKFRVLHDRHRVQLFQ